MIKKYKTLIIIMCMLLLFWNYGFGKITTTSIHIDSIHYNLYSDGKKTVDRNSLLHFHSLFSSSLYTICSDYNTAIPSIIHVNLTSYAWIFKSITGFDSSIAGLFDSNKNQFFFQNPHSLIASRLAENIIKHEILHYVININRKGSSNNATSMLWLEESLCESTYLSQKKLHLNINQIMKNIYSVHCLKSYLNSHLHSKNRLQREQAYAIASQWGLFLKNKLGRKVLFNIITQSNNEKSVFPLFKEFKSRFH